MFIQIEDLSQQAQMQAAEKFKAPEMPERNAASTVSETIQEESEDEAEVMIRFFEITP